MWYYNYADAFAPLDICRTVIIIRYILYTSGQTARRLARMPNRDGEKGTLYLTTVKCLCSRKQVYGVALSGSELDFV